MQVCKHIYTCIFYLSWLGVRRVSMVTHPSYQIFPYSRCSSPFPTLNYSLSLSIQYFYFLLPSCSVILSLSHLFFFPFLCVSLSVTPSIYSSVSPCVFISLYFCFPHYQSFLSHPRLPYPLSLLLLFPSRSSITRVSILLPLSPFSFCLSLSYCAVSLLLRKKTIHCQYSRPRLSTMKPTFFTGVNSHYQHIYVSFLLFFFKGR